MEQKLIELEQKLLEQKTEIAKLKEICDNLIEKIKSLEEGSGMHGIYLDGVEEYYKESILKTLSSEKR